MRDEGDEDRPQVRVYSWGARWTEVYYGEDDWPSWSCRWWVFEPWWWN